MSAPKVPGPSAEQQEAERELNAERRRTKQEQLAERRRMADQELERLRQAKQAFVVTNPSQQAISTLSPANSINSDSLFSNTTPQ